MAKVLLLSATPADDETDYNLVPVTALRMSAQQDRCGVHVLTDNSDAADVILFAEAYGAGWYFERIRRHPLMQAHREKCFIFCSNPYVIPFVPGLYTSLNERWSSSRTRPGFYLGVPTNEFATYTPPDEHLPYLYSFMGSLENATVRYNLLRLQHPRGFLRDTSGDFARYLHRKMGADEKRAYYQRYAETTQRSKFVLCPRGLSVSSIRVFETMRMGRVPVILADGWVAPRGPNWKEFAIHVREDEWPKIPRLLEEREVDAPAMGERARQAWEEWFSDEVAFHRAVESCLSIVAERRWPERFARWPVYLQYLRPFHLRHALGAKLRAAKEAALHPLNSRAPAAKTLLARSRP